MKYLLSIFSLCSLHAHDDLDHFLNEKGYFLTPGGTAVYEGYITLKQRIVFVEELKKLPGIKKIAEVGFNAGHTSEIFLQHADSCQVVSFDINSHSYTAFGVKYIQTKYKDRFQFVEGDSRHSIIEFSKMHPNESFDLIYIDGSHLFTVCLDDIVNFKSLAHKDSIVWIDDTHFPDVKKAVDLAERLHIIQVVKAHYVEDEMGIRAWMEARYIFKHREQR